MLRKAHSSTYLNHVSIHIFYIIVTYRTSISCFFGKFCIYPVFPYGLWSTFQFPPFCRCQFLHVPHLDLLQLLVTVALNQISGVVSINYSARSHLYHKCCLWTLQLEVRRTLFVTHWFYLLLCRQAMGQQYTFLAMMYQLKLPSLLFQSSAQASLYCVGPIALVNRSTGCRALFTSLWLWDNELYPLHICIRFFLCLTPTSLCIWPPLL